jgi:beta-xylosidase
MIGVDIDNDGIGEPVIQYKKPIQGYPVTAPGTDDDFTDDKLGPQWEWNHNPRNSHWSLLERPGWLRLKAGEPLALSDQTGPTSNMWSNDDGSQTTFWRAYNTLSQRILGITTGIATAKFDISNMTAGQRAGFVRYGGVYHLLGIHQQSDGKRNLFFMDKLGEEMKGPEIMSNDFFVRTANTGNKAYFEYSLDGQTYNRFGPDFIIEFGKWTGDRLGFFCWNEIEEKGFVDVDWYSYDYDGPKSAKIDFR